MSSTVSQLPLPSFFSAALWRGTILVLICSNPLTVSILLLRTSSFCLPTKKPVNATSYSRQSKMHTHNTIIIYLWLRMVVEQFVHTLRDPNYLYVPMWSLVRFPQSLLLLLLFFFFLTFQSLYLFINLFFKDQSLSLITLYMLSSYIGQ